MNRSFSCLVITAVLFVFFTTGLISADETNVATSSSKNTSGNQIQQSSALDAGVFDFLTKRDLIKNSLIQEGSISAEEVKNILRIETLQPEVRKTLKDYTFITGKAGTVEANLPQGEYKINVEPIPGVDIQIPEVINLIGTTSLIIPVKITKGSGQVKKTVSNLTADTKQDLVSGLSKVKVVTLSENNNQILPWAGVTVTLERLDQKKGIVLSAGWNLITLTALPTKPLTASILLDQIAKQGGSATTVSTLVDGAWKSYVARGDQDYSLDDFLIEPGKAYFVKALKPSKFTFTGQNFVEPIKLKLSSGWNAVGLPVLSKKTKAQYKVSDLLDDLNTQQVGADTAAQWDSGLWDTFVKKNQDQYGNNFGILSNGGYILKVGKETEFSP